MVSLFNVISMILFGAGSSIPFDIPGMAGFTKRFIARNDDITEFMTKIGKSISNSEEIIGVPLSFDLEALLSILNDLSEAKPEKPISIATASLLVEQGLDIKTAREKYGDVASTAFDRLRKFIFKICMQPIRKGERKRNFGFLDRFYGPLLTVLNRGDLTNIQNSVRKIYTTNWDLCFKTWSDYVSIPIDDLTRMDKQSLPILDYSKEFRSTSGFHYVPLHGSIDLVKISRLKGKGSYEEVQKITGKPKNIRDVFIIYPLEAIGYEESVKSPYLDMLNLFRSSLRAEEIIFIIGYSLRDPTIGSIFEEIIGERIRNGDLAPTSKSLDLRKSEGSKHRFKIIVINPNPEKLVENLRKQFSTNLLQTFIPIKIEFPKTTDEKFDEKMTGMLSQLIEDFVHIRYITTEHAERIVGVLNLKYGTRIKARDFPWKKKK